MIQRVQTLYLLGAVLLNLLLFYIPVYQFVPNTVIENVTASRNYSLSENALLAILNGGVGVLSFLAIFLFKKRNLQIRLTNLCLLLTAILTGLLFFVADTLSGGMDMRVKYIFGSYLPMIELIVLFIAVRYIKRDENLIRSAERLR